MWTLRVPRVIKLRPRVRGFGNGALNVGPDTKFLPRWNCGGNVTTVVRLGPVVAMVSLLGEAVQQQAHMPAKVAWLLEEGECEEATLDVAQVQQPVEEANLHFA